MANSEMEFQERYFGWCRSPIYLQLHSGTARNQGYSSKFSKKTHRQWMKLLTVRIVFLALDVLLKVFSSREKSVGILPSRIAART